MSHSNVWKQHGKKLARFLTDNLAGAENWCVIVCEADCNTKEQRKIFTTAGKKRKEKKNQEKYK